jgi:hypothetical protein
MKKLTVKIMPDEMFSAMMRSGMSSVNIHTRKFYSDLDDSFHIFDVSLPDRDWRDSSDWAEEIFDLMNNPGRAKDRKKYFPEMTRSISVGDVVEVDGKNYICNSIGWSVLGNT